MKEIILASASPRRKELLSELIGNFRIQPSFLEEKTDENRTPAETVCALAEQKAKDVFSRNCDAVVLGADTVVSLGKEILGKPKDEADAVRMLRSLSGKTHQVITGVCIAWEGSVLTDYCVTDVSFRTLTDEAIADYVKSGVPMDKAGAYAIQDNPDMIAGFNGSYTNVVGLPMELLQTMLQKCGVIGCLEN